MMWLRPRRRSRKHGDVSHIFTAATWPTIHAGTTATQCGGTHGATISPCAIRAHLTDMRRQVADGAAVNLVLRPTRHPGLTEPAGPGPTAPHRTPSVPNGWP